MKTNKGLPYGISFETKTIPGKVEVVTVALDKVFIGMEDSVRVDLCEHPLYHHLVKYVQNNPRPKKGKLQ